MITGFIIFTVLFLIALGIYIFNRDRISLLEFGAIVAAFSLIILIGCLLSSIGKTLDTEVYNGKVISKERKKVDCEHSYSCNCHEECSGSGKDRSCEEECDTCYEHDYDIDWNVNTTIGTYHIDRLDSQGLKQPDRWTSVKPGDPVSKTVMYTNWVKAVPNSLFHGQTAANMTPIPAYPLKIYDYYKIDRIVLDGIQIPNNDYVNLNTKIAENLKDLGATKQVNLIIVLTNKEDTFGQDLRVGWLNGKKNDLIIVIGSKQYPKIDWVDVFGWSEEDMVNVKTRDDIREYGKIDSLIVDLATQDIQKYWHRKPMHEYEYLKREVEPGTVVIVILTILGLSTIIGLSIIFIKNRYF